MKKFINSLLDFHINAATRVAIIILALCALFCDSFAEVHKEGNVFSTTTSSTGKRESSLQTTPYFYKGKDGQQRPILINTKSGRCYVKRTSAKTGKEYNAAVPEEIAREVAKAMGIPYKEK